MPNGQTNGRLEKAISEFGTHSEFAQALGVHEVQVRRWIKGQRPIRVHRQMIARKLKIKQEELWPR